MGKRLRGAGSPAALAALDADDRMTSECTWSLDFHRRIKAIGSQTGESPGQITERLLGPMLLGVRVASVPERLMPPGKASQSPGKSETEEAAQTGQVVASETGQATEVSQSPAPSDEPGRGGKRRKTAAELASEFAARRAG